MHPIQKRAKSRFLMYTGWQMLLLAVLFVTLVMQRLTKLANYSVQRFLHYYLILNIRHNKLPRRNRPPGS